MTKTKNMLNTIPLVILIFACLLVAHNPVFADDPEGTAHGMKMEGDSAVQGMAGMKMDGMGDSWQDQINKISYPITAVLALFATMVCFVLIRTTGLFDKFGLMVIALTLFVVEAVLGVLHYTSSGAIVTMPTLMLIMSSFTSMAMLCIAYAFYRWNRMLAG